MSVEFERGHLQLKSLMLLYLLITGNAVQGQPTTLQIGQNEVLNWTVPNSQRDFYVMMSSAALTQLKLISLILEEVKAKSDQQIGKHSTPTSGDSTVLRDAVLVQQHYGGTTFFSRSWDELKFEFGDVNGNYWIGNERLHQLTKDGSYKLRVDLVAKANSQWYWAEYHTFQVSSESTKYRLEIGEYNGTAGDSMAYHNGMMFSARDKEYDVWVNGICAQHADYGNNGGFWYKDCAHANINSPISGTYGFAWYHLPIGSGWADRKLITSRLTLFLK